MPSLLCASPCPYGRVVVRTISPVAAVGRDGGEPADGHGHGIWHDTLRSQRSRALSSETTVSSFPTASQAATEPPRLGWRFWGALGSIKIPCYPGSFQSSV